MDNVNFFFGKTLFFYIFGLSRHSNIIDNLMIFATNYLIFLTFISMLFLMFKGKLQEKKALFLSILAIPIATALIIVIHIFIKEPRPFVTYHLLPLVDNVADASFPSRHATIMAVFAFAYTFYKSRWASIFLFLMLWVGFSRIYIGVHYPLDIIGGFITGIISIALALQIKKLLGHLLL